MVSFVPAWQCFLVGFPTGILTGKLRLEENRPFRSRPFSKPSSRCFLGILFYWASCFWAIDSCVSTSPVYSIEL